VVVVRPRFVAGQPGRQRLGRLDPVHESQRDQCDPDNDGEPNDQTVPLHRASLVICFERGALNGPSHSCLRGTRCVKASPPKGGEGLRAGEARPKVRPSKTQRAPRRAPFEFAESISLSSTGSADLRLPPTAFASGFDLLALRTRRRQESRRGQVHPQEVRKTKKAQFAEIQFSTFPQQTLQLVERPSRALE
jgi:hypothetical protein